MWFLTGGLILPETIEHGVSREPGGMAECVLILKEIEVEESGERV